MTNPFREGYENQIPALPNIYLERFGELTNGYFVEVGAFDGYTWSCTYPLAEIGWGGLYVEPQLDYYRKCVYNHRQHPNVHVEHCAVGDEEGEVNLYLAGSLTTVEPKTVAVYSDLAWSRWTGICATNFIRVPMVSLDTLLVKHHVPVGFDLLVVDVEGAEVRVLNGFALAHYQPRMAIIETHADYPDPRLNWKAPVIDAIFSEQGYSLIHHDHVNSIYWREHERPRPAPQDGAST